MTLAEIKKMREEVGENTPLIIVADNQHIFYDNCGDSCSLIWDDELERLISFEKNIDHVQTQARKPALVTYTSYEHIQFIEVLLTVPEVIEILNKFKDKMTEEQYKYCIKFYSTSASVHGCIPGSLTKADLEAQNAVE